MRCRNYRPPRAAHTSLSSATSHLYDAKLSHWNYKALGGGMPQKADGAGATWCRSSAAAIQSGDTIVVQLDAECMPWLSF